MTKTLTGYDVLVYVKDISNNVIFALKMMILMTVVTNMHKTSFMFISMAVTRV